MGGLSIWHWLIVLIYVGAVIFPVSRILQRLGLSGWWSLLSVVPIVNIVALWALAVVSWPQGESK